MLVAYWTDSRKLLTRLELMELHGSTVLSVTQEEVLIQTASGKVAVVALRPKVLNGDLR